MVLDDIEAPLVLAPLGGGPSTPELAAAVSRAGGLGFVAGAYLSAVELASRVAATRSLTDRPFGVNLFAPVPGPTDAASYRAYESRIAEWARRHSFPTGAPSFGDDGYAAKLELLAGEAPAVVSFTFGLPDRAAIDGLHAAGSEVWVTVTTPSEAGEAASAGCDALVVQGAEAGGHRGGFGDRDDDALFGLFPLLQLIAAHDAAIPLVASGGIASGAAVAAVLAAGARAAQLGSAFMLAEEAGTTPAHREALRGTASTSLTRAFTGRTARGIRNAFMDEHDPHAPQAYPEVHYLTAPLRKAARERHDGSAINLWAGQAYELAAELPAARIVETVMEQAREAHGRAGARLGAA